MDSAKMIIILIAAGIAAFYGIILYLDRQGRRKNEGSDEGEEKDYSLSDRNVTSVVYPPGFEFLEEMGESINQPVSLDEEVQKLVKTFEDQTTEVYQRFHRLLKYSDKVTRTEEESEKTKLQLQNELARLGQENRNLQEIKKSQAISIREFEENLKNLKNEYQQRVSETEETRQEFDDERNSLTQTCAELESKIHEYEEKIKSLETEYTGLAEMHEEDTRNTTAAQEEINRLGQVEQSYNALKQEMEVLAEENARLKEGPSPEDVESLTAEKGDLSIELETLQNRYSELEQTVEQLKSEQEKTPSNDSVTKTLYTENKDLSGRLEEAEAELETLRAEMTELQEFKDKKDSFQLELQQSIQAETALLEQEVSRLKQELEETRAAAAESAELQEQIPQEDAADPEEVGRLQREIIKRDNEISQLSETIEDLKRRTTSVSKEREDEVSFLHEEISKKKEAIEQERSTATGFQEQMDRMQSEFEEEHVRYEKLEEKNRKLQTRIESLLESEDSVQVAMGSLEDKLGEKDSSIAELNKYIQTMEEKLEDEKKKYEDTVAFLEHQVNKQDMEELDTEKVKDDFKRKITDKEEKIDELESQVAGFNREREEWKQEGDFLREKIGTLEKAVKEEEDEAVTIQKVREENKKYINKILRLNEQLTAKDREIETISNNLKEFSNSSETLRLELDQVKAYEMDLTARTEKETAEKEMKLSAYAEVLDEKDEENNSIRSKLISAEDLVQGLKDRIGLLENEVRERTISEKEHITCSKCFKDIPSDDLTLKKAQRIDEKIFCKYCLEEMEHEARELVIEDRLEKLASLVSELRLRQNWSEYKEIDICEELVSLGKKHIDVLSQIMESEQDDYVRDTLSKVIDMVKSGESPQDVLIDDDLEKTAYLMQKLRQFPGKPDEGKGLDICRQLVALGHSIEILLRGIINQEKNPAVRDALKRVKTAIENECPFDDVT